jgi:mannose-1-phosphate guanylyltransferase
MSEVARVHGIVVAGAYPSGSVLDSLVPRPLLPIAQQPLITYALRWMHAGGIKHVTICANSAARSIRSRLGRAALGMGIDYLEDWNPRGAAGCVRDAGERTAGDTFVVADGTALPVSGLDELLEAHFVSEAVLTLVVGADATGRLCPTGIYAFDRRAFAHVPADGYQDIKERLIPRLYEAGETVVTHVTAAVAPRVVNTDSYLALDAWAVERLVHDPQLDPAFRAWGDAVIHESVRVHPGARLLGPMLLGAGCVVASEATLVGPLSLGVGVSVGRRAVVSRSVVWDGCEIADDALVDRSMLAEGVRVEPGRSVFASVRTSRRRAPTPAWSPSFDAAVGPALRPVSVDRS